MNCFEQILNVHSFNKRFLSSDQALEKPKTPRPKSARPAQPQPTDAQLPGQDDARSLFPGTPVSPREDDPSYPAL